MLFYMVTNPLTDRLSLRAVYPLEEGDSLNIPVDCENVDMYEVFGMQGRAFLYVDSFYEITADGKFVPCQDTGSLKQNEEKIHEYEIQLNTYMQQQAQSKQVIAQLEATIESAKAQYNELMETAIAYRDEAIKWRSKFI